MVGGQTFKTVAAFEKKIGQANSVATLPPGQSVKIFVGPMTLGGAFPHLTGLNKSSPFTVKFDKGYITITAKPTAKLGATDSVKLDHGGPVVQHPKPTTKFPFKLEVGLGTIMMG
jgi:hypothetical protein